MNKNLSKLQSEAVKEFDQNFDQYNPRNEVGFTVPTTGNGYQQIKQFLSDQIQKAVKKTRKGMIKQIRKMETSSYTLEGAYLNENIDFICKKLKKLSLNPKENNK